MITPAKHWIQAQGDEKADAFRKPCEPATPAEQAVPAGVRVKNLVWVKHPTAEIWRSGTFIGTYKVFGIGGPSWDYDSATVARDCTSRTAATVDAAKDAAQADYAARIIAALEPDPTPALSWRAMQTAAIEAVAKEAQGETVLGGQRFRTAKLEDAVEAIRALPGPTDAQLLAEAVKLPEVQELVKASKWVGFAAQTSGGTAGRDMALIAAIDVLAAALAKIGEAK